MIKVMTMLSMVGVIVSSIYLVIGVIVMWDEYEAGIVVYGVLITMFIVAPLLICILQIYCHKTLCKYGFHQWRDMRWHHEDGGSSHWYTRCECCGKRK